LNNKEGLRIIPIFLIWLRSKGNPRKAGEAGDAAEDGASRRLSRFIAIVVRIFTLAASLSQFFPCGLSASLLGNVMGFNDHFIFGPMTPNGSGLSVSFLIGEIIF
jgi:hypothetical protein